MNQKQSRRAPTAGRKRISAYAIVGTVVLAAATWYATTRIWSAEDKTLASLKMETHFHGIAVDANDPSRLYLATHHGLYVVDPTGASQLISETRDDFMGFTPHPSDPGVLYASGHPTGGGNAGFIMSGDGGRSWTKLSDGLGGPVDFHQTDVSKVDPKVIYGVYGDIQKSTDGGHSWTIVGPSPDGIIDLAAGRRPDTLYAATERGLLRSIDDGKTWQPAYNAPQPVTIVETTAEGGIYAFVVGTGLLHAKEPNLDWKIIDDFAGQYVIYFAVMPGDDRRLYAVTLNPSDRTQSLMTSADGGESWAPLGE